MMQCAADSVADRKLYYIGIYIYIYIKIIMKIIF